MADNVTEIFTTVKNCEQQFPYKKGRYFLVHKNVIVTILEIPMDVYIYISKTFYNYLEKQGKLIFSHHFCNYATYNSSMKSNVLNYGLKPVYSEYNYLDTNYKNIFKVALKIKSI